MNDDNEELFNQLEDPEMGQLDSHALMLHELYSSYVRAGFTDDQSMGLILSAVNSGPKPELDDEFDYDS
jgi:hypothetical protein